MRDVNGDVDVEHGFGARLQKSIACTCLTHTLNLVFVEDFSITFLCLSGLPHTCLQLRIPVGCTSAIFDTTITLLIIYVLGFHNSP